MLFEGIPAYIRSDNGPEMVAKVLRQWLKGLGSKSLYIEPGSPWENGYCELFNGKLRDELLSCLSGFLTLFFLSYSSPHHFPAGPFSEFHLRRCRR